MADAVMATTVKVGISVHDSLMVADPARRRALLSLIEQAGLDYVCVGDHVSFHDGTGFDGLTRLARGRRRARRRRPGHAGLGQLGAAFLAARADSSS